MTAECWHLAHPADGPHTCSLLAGVCHRPLSRAFPLPRRANIRATNTGPLGVQRLYLHFPPESLTDTPDPTDPHGTHGFSLWPRHAQSQSMASLFLQTSKPETSESSLMSLSAPSHTNVNNHRVLSILVYTSSHFPIS